MGFYTEALSYFKRLQPLFSSILFCHDDFFSPGPHVIYDLKEKKDHGKVAKSDISHSIFPLDTSVEQNDAQRNR